MSFPFDIYPWANYQELNLAYFIARFQEIFRQWADLYDTMTAWQAQTDADLEAWKDGVVNDIIAREAALRQELTAWKASTEQDISSWESATLAALTAWQTAAEAQFETIRQQAAASATAAAGSAADAVTAKSAAETAQAASEAAAASISASAAQIAKNASDIGDIKNALQNAVNTPVMTWEAGGLYAATGLPYPSADRIRSLYIPITGGDTIRISNPDELKYTLHVYGSDQVSDHSAPFSDVTNKDRAYRTPATAWYVRVMVTKTGAIPSDATRFMIQTPTINAPSIAYTQNQILKAGDDLNDLTTPGNYSAPNAAASSISNLPETTEGKLLVMTLTQTAAIFQLYITTGNKIYTRHMANGIFRAWKRLFTESDFKTAALSLKQTDSTVIADNSDIDDLTSPGNYKIESATSARTMTHLPTVNAGRLIVLELYVVNSTHQIYIDSTGKWYIRQKISGSFENWREITDNIQSAAITLKLADNITIPAASNINDYTTPGNYIITSASSAQSMVNLPSVYGGKLVVMQLYISAAIHQLYIDSEGNWYIRRYANGQFRAWKRLAVMSDVENVDSRVESKAAYNAICAIGKISYNIAFANAFAPLPLKNYLGDSQNVHPKVLYFANGFGGHDFWMAYTPYPYSDDQYENPCIAYSDDGYAWTNIGGNPIDDPNSTTSYNSDTHLVYREDTNTLECWYRYVEKVAPKREILYRQTSTDGINWSEKEIVKTNTSGVPDYMMSPAVIVENGKYCMWTVYGEERTGIARYSIDYFEAPLSDVTDWTYVRSFTFSISDGGVTVWPWHIDVIKDGNQYAMLIMARHGESTTNNPVSLFTATSPDNEAYSAPVKVVGGADNWDAYMYRSSIVKVGSTYRIYYSAGAGGIDNNMYSRAVWGLGITESNTLSSGYIGRYM